MRRRASLSLRLRLLLLLTSGAPETLLPWPDQLLKTRTDAEEENKGRFFQTKEHPGATIEGFRWTFANK